MHCCNGDNLRDPGVCGVSLLSSSGCTTLIVDCALGSDNPRIAISIASRTDRSAIGWTSKSLDMFPMHFPCASLSILASIRYGTVQYGNTSRQPYRQAMQKWPEERGRIKCC